MQHDNGKGVQDVKEKAQDFYSKARAGSLDDASLRWGLSAAAVVAGLSLLLPYISFGFGMFGRGASIRGIDLLTFRGGDSLNSLAALAIPAASLFSLYLSFLEPSLKLIGTHRPDTTRKTFIIGCIASALGVLGCYRIVSFGGITIGNMLGTAGLALLAFVYFKLWKATPE